MFGSQLRTKRLETQLSDLEHECARLLQTLDQTKSERDAIRARVESSKTEAEQELTTTKSELDVVKGKLALYGDYDEIKRELEIMKVSGHWRSKKTLK